MEKANTPADARQAPLISVIVPVYRVEPYLRKCLDSIIAQTYHNLEIILVDDGSPDNCGAICDEYAAKDTRIRVIHKENGGVSSARNTGLDETSGDWVGWVDADDWVEPDMFAYLLDHAIDSGSEIAVCSNWEHYPGHTVFRGWDRVVTLDTEQALQRLLEADAMRCYLCDKLWKRALFEGVRFPDGKVFEDVSVAYRLFLKARRVICLPEAKYHYLQRAESVSHLPSLQLWLDCFAVSKERMDALWDTWPQYRDLLEAGCIYPAISLWSVYFQCPPEERKHCRPALREVAAFSRSHQAQMLKEGNLGLGGKAVVRLTRHASSWSFALAWAIGKLHEFKHRLAR